MKAIILILGGLFLCSTAIAQWMPLNSGTTKTLLSVDFIDVNTGYAVGDSGTIIKTSDGGENWCLQNSGTSVRLRSVFFVNSEIGYVVGNDGVILNTTDGGTTWNAQESWITDNLNSVWFVDNQTGYAVSEAKPGNTWVHILKTTDGGSFWMNSYIYYDTMSIQIFLNSIFFLNSDIGYVLGCRKQEENIYVSFLLKTENGGLNWEYKYAGPFAGKGIWLLSPDTCFIVGADSWNQTPIIWRTTDGGQTWSVAMYPGPHYGRLYSICFSDNNTGYAVGAYPLRAKSVTAGTSWSLLKDIGGNDVDFPAVDTGYIVSWSGAIYKTTNGGIVGIDFPPAESDVLQIYPNPVTSSITIDTPQSGYLLIYNINNQMLVNQITAAHKTVVDFSTFPAGVYLIKVIWDEGVRMAKIIKE